MKLSLRRGRKIHRHSSKAILQRTCIYARDLPLLQGTYSIDLFLSEEYQNIDVIYDAISFEVIEADVFGTGQVPSPSDGSIFWQAEFEMNTVEVVAGTH